MVRLLTFAPVFGLKSDLRARCDNLLGMSETSGKIVILSTCGSAEEAERVARGLVEAQVAACVNIVAPVRSIYRWQGKVEDATEWLLVIKTQAALFDAVQQQIRRLHSYEVPEVIALEVTKGAEAYLAWIASETTGGV